MGHLDSSDGVPSNRPSVEEDEQAKETEEGSKLLAASSQKQPEALMVF